MSPDYRLLPEATGTDILEDVSSFWEWVHKGLSTELAKIDDSISADLSSILVVGESAGESALIILDHFYTALTHHFQVVI